MKKVLQPLVIAVLAIPTFANAAQTTAPVAQDGKTTVVSPRTGIRYTVDNPDQRPVVLQTAAIAAATSVNADRIVATNPALSTASQQTAKQALIEDAKKLARN